MSTGDLSDLTALEQSAAVRGGEVTAVELTSHYLERCSRLDDQVGAFAHLAPESALAQAAAVDTLLRQGNPADADPLAGCVVPVKDLDLVAGMPCSFGSRAFAEFVPDTDSAFVARMRAAGLVITGKTATPEFGLPAYTENDLGHTARTPWDVSRTAGGSSGGAAAAVATGLASVAQGSDGGGSIRIPASVTGLVGIKPSRGRVSGLPDPEFLGELGVIGPLARTVADAAALLDVLAGSGPADLFGLPAPAPGAFLAAARRDPAPLRVGAFAVPMVVDTEVHPACLAAFDDAVRLLVGLGHDVVEIERPFTPAVVPAFEAVWRTGAAAIPLRADQEHLVTPLTRHLRELGGALRAVDVADAVRQMRQAAVAAITATGPYDVLLTPTLATLPPYIGDLRDDADPAADFDAQKRFTPFTAPFNVSGQPAMSIPVHHTDDGLPVGVQLVGRPRDEETIIALAAQVERVVQWHTRIPPLWSSHG
ncbi:MAG: amidase [Candidatus Nanopelagicales bacterium]